jgi:hypothetical protein
VGAILAGWLDFRTRNPGDRRHCLAALPEGAVVERKTPGDLASCIGSGRERFERELSADGIIVPLGITAIGFNGRRIYRG